MFNRVIHRGGDDLSINEAFREGEGKCSVGKKNNMACALRQTQKIKTTLTEKN